jgi:hypothetical protein
MKRAHFIGAMIIHISNRRLALAGLAAAGLCIVAGEASAQAQTCNPTVTLPGFGTEPGDTNASSDGSMHLAESNSHGTTQVDTFTNPPALPDIPGTVSATALVNVELATVSSTVFGSGDDIQLTLQVSDGHSLRCTGNRTIATTTSSDTGSVVPVSCSFQQAHGDPGIYLATITLLADGGSWGNTADGAVRVQSVDLVLVAPAPHDECTTGVHLDRSCGSCISNVCAADPFCCASGWDGICVSEVQSVCHSLACVGPCPHAPCSTGAALPSSCSPSVQEICTRDPFCCETAWDNICVGEVASIDGDNCS